MGRTRQDVSMGFTREPFPEGIHMCLIFDDDAERMGIISRFLASGVVRGEQVSYLFDKTVPEEVRDWLKGVGMELTRVEEGYLSLSRAESVYYPSGRFVPSEMLARLGDLYDRAISAGYAGARMSGEMSWATRGVPGADRLMEYESLINTISVEHPVTPICQYDARLFDGATLLNALKVHPMMIVRGGIVRNPYYMTPEEYLKGFMPLAA